MECLPTEMVREILLCLPVTTVVVAQCVCRSWRTLVRDPCFARDHPSFGIGGGYLVQHTLFEQETVREPSDLLTYFHNIDEVYPRNPHAFITFSRLPEFDYIAQSCDGLVLLVDTHSRRNFPEGLVYLCNPLLGRWIKLPEKSGNRDVRQRFTRFAFDSASGKYKVFMVTWLRHPSGGFRVLCDVLSLGTGGDVPTGNEWRRAGTVEITELRPKPIELYEFKNGILSGGQLHWLVWTENGLPSVMSIDVQSERVDFSPNLVTNNCVECFLLSMNGRLCLVNFMRGTNLVKYWAYFYGRQEFTAADSPWEQLMICDYSFHYCSNVLSMSPCEEYKMGALLFCTLKSDPYRWHLQYSDLRTNGIRPLQLPKYSRYVECGLIDYTPSLLMPAR